MKEDRNRRRVFISHAATEREFAESLRGLLERDRFSAALPGGSTSFEGVLDVLRASDVVVAILGSTPANVLFEAGVAAGMGKGLVLVGMTLQEVPYDLRHFRYLDFAGRGEDHLPEVVRAVEKSVQLDRVGHAVPEAPPGGEPKAAAPKRHGSHGVLVRRVADALARAGCDVDQDPSQRPDWLLQPDLVVRSPGGKVTVIEVKSGLRGARTTLAAVEAVRRMVLSRGGATHGVLVTECGLTESARAYARSCRPPIDVWTAAELDARLAEFAQSLSGPTRMPVGERSRGRPSRTSRPRRTRPA